MASAADVSRVTATRFVPSLLGATVVGLLLAALTSRHALATLAQVNWPFVPVRIAVVGLGFLAALLAVRRGLDGAVLGTPRQLVMALVATGLPLLVASVVMPRGVVARVGLALGILMDLSAGVAAALVVAATARRSARARGSDALIDG